MTLKITDQIKIEGQFVNYVYQIMFKALYFAYFSRHRPFGKLLDLLNIQSVNLDYFVKFTKKLIEKHKEMSGV